MKIFLQILVTLLIGYGALLTAVYLFQARLIYFPNIAPTYPKDNPTRIGLPYETVRFFTQDGLELHGWFIGARNARPVLLFFHGNGGNITHRLDSIAQFHRLGLSIFIIDYRGYGESEGRPNEQGTYEDARAAWNHLTRDRGIPPGDIVIFGRSLGAAIAAELAGQVEPAALIIESAFTSAPDLAARYYWFLPVRSLSKFQYDTRAHLKKVSCPVLVIHSADDEIVPVEQGRELFVGANDPKVFLEIWGGHNNGFLLSEPVYSNGVRQFLEGI